MPPSLISRMTTWLCLVVTLLMGVTPARGLVICIEADGTIALEAAADDCEGCPEPATRERSDSSTLLAAGDACCECVDIPVSTSVEEQRTVTKRADVRFEAWCPPPSIVVAASTVSGPCVRQSSRVNPPRGSHALRLIRSVVLHV
ncbi:MAG: hypothetical protein ACKVWV_04830 [Planctomycetota bacterium]